ncbi:MAG: hypothetical protein WC860_08450 [Candidatus Margulisiibacteriota bacterium]
MIVSTFFSNNIVRHHAIKDFFDNYQEYKWAMNLSKKEIDFYAQNFDKDETQEIKCYNKLARKSSHVYLSPSGKYRFEYRHTLGKYNYDQEGFIIFNHHSNEIILISNHWVMHPSCVKWIFNEKYIVYMHMRNDGYDFAKLYVYVGNLKTGEIIPLTTASYY